MRKKIVAGNWKMNTLPAEGVELAKQVAAGKHTVCDCVSFIVCPPFTHLSEVSKTLEGTGIAVGAQNCAAEAKGAYTGEVAASMIAALGCKYVILGHSERRQYYGETSETLNRKMEQAYANNLVPIYCVGENLDEREAGKHFDVVKAQIEDGMPVPCLLLKHRDPALKDFVWHWFLLTGYEEFEEVFMVKTVTYGEYLWLDLDRLSNTGFSEKGGLILLNNR